MNVRKEHLTADELEALLRGEETDHEVEGHLSSCAECQAAARETDFGTRYLRPLAGDHPDEHVLTAFWSHALSASREDEIRFHLESCSRCQAVLARLKRATPMESHPSRVPQRAIRRTQSWIAASTEPRRATMVVRAVEGLNPLRATFESITATLRLGGLGATELRSSALGPGAVPPSVLPEDLDFDSILGATFGGSTSSETAEPESTRQNRGLPADWARHLRGDIERSKAGSGKSGATGHSRKAAASSSRQSGPERIVLNDGVRAFRFETRRETVGDRLIVGFFETARPDETHPVVISLDSPGHPAQHSRIVHGGEVAFEIRPGTSRLAIAVNPGWLIEIRLDA